MSAIDAQPFPKGPLVGAFLLVAVSLISVAAVRLGLISGPEDRVVTTAAATVPRTSQDLRFLDRADGAVVVQHLDGRVAAVVAPGEGGFVRGVLRGLARDRKARGLDSRPAFRLTEWADGRLTLEDTATGQILDLDGFGPTNREAFLMLLHRVGRS